MGKKDKVVMVSKRTRQCVKREGRWFVEKARYTTKQAAEMAVRHGDTNAHVYKCAQHGWHIGH